MIEPFSDRFANVSGTYEYPEAVQLMLQPMVVVKDAKYNVPTELDTEF